jgi:hypothetical protein
VIPFEVDQGTRLSVMDRRFLQFSSCFLSSDNFFMMITAWPHCCFRCLFKAAFISLQGILFRSQANLSSIIPYRSTMSCNTPACFPHGYHTILLVYDLVTFPCCNMTPLLPICPSTLLLYCHPIHNSYVIKCISLSLLYSYRRNQP